MKKYLQLTLILFVTALTANQAFAQVDSSFTYQGELQDDGSPANDTYDFQFNLTDSDGFPFGDPSEHLNIDVVNGLFSLNVDFNIDAYDGFGDVRFSIEVRESSVGGPYTSLGTQTIQSVPLATNLTNGDAASGEVLTFNGFQWAPMTPAGSPWTLSGSDVTFASGDVGIGTATPLADLSIDGTSDGNLLRVRVDGTTKLTVDDNGGTAIGSLTVPPTDGLFVRGDTKQLSNSNGLMKYMVTGVCRNNSPSISRSYNGINTSAITVSGGSSTGECIFNLPTDINSRYWQVSAVGVGERGANCIQGATNSQLRCTRFNTTTGAEISGDIMVLIY